MFGSLLPLLPLLALLVPFGAALAIFALPGGTTHPRRIEFLHLVSITAVLAIALSGAAAAVLDGPVTACDEWLLIDPLAAVFLVLIGMVGFLTGAYSIGYIRHDLASGAIGPRQLRTYYGFFSLFLATMLLAIMSNNIVLMWVAIEATTLGSAFLVGLYGKRESLEAAWKYLIICSVGVAFGLYGTVLTFANASAADLAPYHAVLWTQVLAHASQLDPTLARIAFVFALIGFGTKAGIFPMHAWLPDAHSEAPSPVSALLSGVLLKCALFAILRYVILTSRVVGPEFPQLLLMTLGILSVGVAAFLFFVQRDLKRKLAYSSVENIGLILLGIGFGGPLGVGAALLHAVNHSFAKALLFCGSGNILMKYGSRDLGTVRGLLRVAPVSGMLVMVGALALAGFPPFNVFVSEFMTITAGLAAGHYVLVAACVLLLTVAIAGFIQIITTAVLGRAPENIAHGDAGWLVLAPMVALAGIVLLLGVAVPRPVASLLTQATAVVLGTADTASLPLPHLAKLVTPTATR